MKKTTYAATAVVFLALMAACNDAPKTIAEATPSEAAVRIRSMEDSLYAHPAVEVKGAQALVDVYLLYAKTNPTDPLAPEYLLRAAGVKSALHDPQAAVELYDRIIKGYPNWDKAVDAYYLRAFTIDSGLHLKGLAQQAYQEVIDRYPDHKFAADAKQMILNLNYTDEELVAKFQRMNDSTEAAAAAK